MYTKPTRRSSLFLIELMIAILMFSLASMVCIRFFVKSKILEQESYELNHAVTAASSVGEILRSDPKPLPILQENFPYITIYDNEFQIYYNKSWLPCSKQEAVYHLHGVLSYENSMLTGCIEVLKEEASIYTLTIKKYHAKEMTP